MYIAKNIKYIITIVFASALLFPSGYLAHNAYALPQLVPVIILFKGNVTDEDKNLVQSLGGIVTRTYDIINGLAAQLPQDAIAVISNDPRIASVDQDLPVHLLDLSADKQIRADQVWTKGDTGTSIPVAILDTGIDSNHPEFSGRILKCHNEITNTNNCDDANGHGTHTAGIAAAVGANLQAKGVAPSASLYIDQVVTPAGTSSLSLVIAGIDWARTNGAKVISISLGTDPISTTAPNCDTSFPSLTQAVNNAVSAGITVVAAAGNSGSDGVGAPGCISSTIAVGAVDNTDTVASFSSQGGPMADHGITAPGVDIFSSYLLGSYTTLSGTSMATPHVAGIIALMLESNPTLSPEAIKNILFNTACTSTTSPSCPTGTVPNSAYGYGRVDALAAFNAVATPTVPDVPTGLTAAPGDAQVSLSWTTPSSNGGSAITGYNIYRGTTSGGEGTTPIATVSGSVLTYTDTGLTNGVTYFYEVSAVNSIGESVLSNEASAIPSAPPPAPPSPTQVTISVSSVDMSGNPITGMWTVLRYTNGTTITTGFTPASFQVMPGTAYVVHVGNYMTNEFDHWNDGSTSSYYPIAPSDDATLTAYYRTS